MNRSRLLLLLIVLLGIASWYAWQQSPQQQRVSKQKKSREKAISVANMQAKEIGLDFSGGNTNSFHKPKRDLFRLLYPAPVVVKRVVPSPKPKPVVVKTPPPPPKPKPVARPVAGPKPIQPLNVLGFLQKGDEKTVFLASRQGELFLVKKGDRFADDLLVRELDEAHIVIVRNLEDKGVTLQVGAQKKQQMAIPKVTSGRPDVPSYDEPKLQMKRPAIGAGDN